MKIFHASREEIKSELLEILPILKLIRHDNIDFTPIIGAKCELADSEEKIYFKIKNVSNCDKQNLNKLLTNNYFDYIPNTDKNYYIYYQTYRAIGAIGNNVKSNGGIMGFSIEVNGVFYDEIGEFIDSIQFFNNLLLNEELTEYNKTLLEVSDMCYEAIVETVRDKIDLQKGKFIMDNITENIYIQRRLTDNGELIDYIMNDYFAKILSEVNWVDVSNEGTIYCSL